MTYSNIAVASNAVTQASVSVRPAGASTARPPQGMPIAMGRDELFFWERDWQNGERESAEARENGETVSFDNSTDLLKWLMSDD